MPTTILSRLSRIQLLMTPRRLAVEYLTFAHAPSHQPGFSGQALIDRMFDEIEKKLRREERNRQRHTSAPRANGLTKGPKLSWLGAQSATGSVNEMPKQEARADLHEKVRISCREAFRRACFLVELYSVAFQNLETQLRLSFELTTTVSALLRTGCAFNREVLEKLELQHNLLMLSAAIVERVESEYLHAKVLPAFFREICLFESEVIRGAIQLQALEPRLPSAKNYVADLRPYSDFAET